MNKRAIIIHCWEGYPDYCWYPWVKKKLEEKGFDVVVPQMPDTNNPKFDKWFSKLKEVINKPDENLFLVGHSLGCVTILKYLEQFNIGGAVLVAGFTDSLGIKEIESFFEKPLDLEGAKRHCNSFTVIHSDNDPYVDLKHGYIFKEKLNAKLIIKKNMGHFSGEIENEKSCTELQEVVDAIC